LDIPATDTTTYYCKVSFQEDTTCYFTLSTVAIPRFPFAEFDYELTTKNCQRILKFNNRSHILTKREGNIIHTTEKCESYLWDFGGRKSDPTENPQFIFDSNDADTLYVTLSAFIADGDCMEDTTIRIIVPAIGQTLDTVYHTMCQGEFYTFGHKGWVFAQGGDYYDTIPGKITGCDSITMLRLKVNPMYDMPTVNDTICFGESYSFGGKVFTTSQNKKEIWLHTVLGCDSIVTLNLKVWDEITFNVSATPAIVTPNTGVITLDNISIPNYTYSVNGVLNAPLTGLNGGVYEIILYNEWGCPSVPQEVKIVQDCLEITMDSIPEICGDELYFIMNYTIDKGFATTYNVIFDSTALAAGFTDISAQANGNPIQILLPDSVRPDNYKMNIVFEDKLCEDIDKPVDFTVKYPSSVLAQKWNDVIVVYNQKHNGGYEFSAFRWYKNGVEIPDESGSYLYVGLNGDTLETDAEYAALLTRADDGKSVFTCPFVPVQKNVSSMPNMDISLYPTIVNQGETVILNVLQAATTAIYDYLGRQTRFISVNRGANAIIMNEKQGLYLMRVITEYNEIKIFKIIIK
jgi:hypothetical protein